MRLVAAALAIPLALLVACDRAEEAPEPKPLKDVYTYPLEGPGLLGTLRLHPADGRACWTFDTLVKGSQIHFEEHGPSDGVAVELFRPPRNRLNGCTDADSDILETIVRSPGDYYVDTHFNEKDSYAGWAPLDPTPPG